MKLAEALILRADCQNKVGQLKQRLTSNARVQEGETPAETPQELLAELESTLKELETLIRKINRTNNVTTFQAGVTLADALAIRDVLTMKRNAYSDLVATATLRFDRYSRSEVKSVSVVNVVELQKTLDQLAKQHRELDTQIQALNWNTELIS